MDKKGVVQLNQYGLSRDIPGPIKREVRQRCGFGCVICGRALYQYEHVDPEFAEARAHDPDCIVLLCGGCHDLVTRGILSKQTVKAKSKQPKCRETGFSFGPFDIGNLAPEISLGTIIAKNCRTLIRVDNDEVFQIRPPAEAGLPFLLNARFFDVNGDPILDVVENEWRSSLRNWDVEVVGPRITIRRSLGNLALILRSEPPGRIFIERLDMLHKGVRVQCFPNQAFQVVSPDGSIIRASGFLESENAEVLFDADGDGVRMGIGGTMRTASTARREPPTNVLLKAGGTSRNALCPCGSGIKFKRCHGRIV